MAPSSRSACVRTGIRDGYAPKKIKRLSDNMMKTGVVRFPVSMTETHAVRPPYGMNMGEKTTL
ncbi:MAG: hypothetical protein B6245_08930 [Desulfobacteraceae bacterium 4572_88]|nr:MAG: hypothetical protein B6245_08930 [Desulfobacteraceae bacterium 4572_88]